MGVLLDIVRRLDAKKLISKLESAGVNLAISPMGTLKAVGKDEVINALLPIMRQNKAALLNAVKERDEQINQAILEGEGKTLH